ncbi:MAG: DegV family protein [Solirubrobacterales bacterium]|nr:DegV family protein [Solirubrobacterales bacterium]HMT05492.1 DegV family protein [Solirubrobacterales bacterium]
MSADPNIALVTDSTASLTKEDRERLDISVVNLYVILNGEQRRENEIDDYASFYKAVLESPQLTTTSQPSVGDFMEVYAPLLDAGKDVISLHLSGGISGTCEAARQAAGQLEADGLGGERITVVDSRTTAGGLALTTLGAANAIAAGKSVEECVAQIEGARDGLETLIMVDTLEYLRKGGRIGGAQAWIGGALKIKPLITLEETVRPVEKVRTTSRAMQRLKDFASEKAASGEEITWTAQHIQAPELAAELAAHCREVFQCEGAFLDEMFTVLGCHAGPGLVAIGTVPTALVGSKF